MRADYATPELLRVLMAAMQPENALALEISLQTGLRIDDVLSLRPWELRGRTLTVTEKKTGKQTRKTITAAAAERLRSNGNADRCFPSLRGAHRSRTTVYKDLHKAAEYYGVKLHISPHSARKAYAVQVYHEKGLNAAQRALNHDNAGTTLIYALSDVLTGQSGEETAPTPKTPENGENVLEMLRKLLKMTAELSEKVDKLLDRSEP